MAQSNINSLAMSVKNVRLHIKEKICSKVKFDDFVEQKKELLNIFEKTLKFGESDSALIVGPRGVGKSYLVKDCLISLAASYGNDDYLVINLNGLIHTDDNLALRAIIEQVHVNDLDGEQITGSFSDNLLFVIQSLKSGDKATAAPMIFILDEFQLFSQHRNQTLLYNLLDISKSAQTPVCVIGITCRLDITELLEKRVSSRFSQRQIVLLPSLTLKNRLSQFSEYFKIPKKIPSLRKMNQKYINEWNESIDKLLEIPSVNQHFLMQLDVDFSRKSFKNVSMALISKVTVENPFITVNDVEEAFRRYHVDERVEYLKDLSVLELCLIIAMSHQVEIYDGEPFNFEMIAKRYLRFAQNNSAVQITRRPILLKAFERIKELELILPVTQSTRNQKKEYVLYNLMVMKPQLRCAVYSYAGLPTDVSQWALTNPI